MDNHTRNAEGVTPPQLHSYRPQIKICGLTQVHEAMTCASLGADAIGFIFYPASPRAVSADEARDISMALPASVCRVGVFVDEDADTILDTVATARLQAVQLHGMESPRLVEQIAAEEVLVIKTLFSHREPFFKEASSFPATAFLVECGEGPLPGGNARVWDFSLLKNFGETFPLILAGGLSIANVGEAIRQCRPDVVDISSGVEREPGKKDLVKVKQFITAVRTVGTATSNRRIFHGNNG